MQSSGFSCENCGAENETLNVHHSYYEKGLPPWQYPDGSLHCLCEECHKKAQNLQTLIQRQIGRLDLSAHETAYGYMAGLEMSDFPMVVFEVFSYEMAMGIGDSFGIDAESVIDSKVDGKIDGYKLSDLKKRLSKK